MAHRTVGVFLSVLISSLLAASKDSCDVYAAIGQSLTMPFSVGLTNADVLRWTHNSTIVFSRDQGRVSVGKADDISPVGSLMLRDVKSSSAGIYEVQLRNRNGTLSKTWQGRLCIMDKVLKPQLTFVCDFKANAVHLKCQVAKPEGLSFSWTLDDKPLTGETKPSLSVSLTQLKGSFTCSAANRVSKDKSDTARPNCKAPPPPPPAVLCFAPMTVTATLAGGGILILILLTIITALCCCRRRRQLHEPGRIVGERGPVRMLSLKRQEADSCCPEYETMQPPEDSPPPIPAASTRACYENVSRPEGQAENRASQLAAAADEKKPSPVPKPRTKAPQTPNV